LALSILNHN